MATYTDNYHLSKPETTDSQQSFMEDYATNMDIIDENMGGGSGGGGHVIIDENGTEVAQEPNMQFAGKVEVADDPINEKTVVEVLPEVVEVTLAEYIALGNVVNTDGKLYCITDLNNSDVQGYPPLIYSDEEREVGVWRDGKPLYQKTVHVGALVQDSSWHAVPHGVANLDTCIKFEAFCIATNGTEFYSINLYRPTTSTGVMIYITASNIYYMNNYYSEMDDTYVTIWYTKTTDTAGSGIWNGQGGYAHHYSTSEKVIGTWIDGKPLYEKSFNITSSIAQNTTYVVASITGLIITEVQGIALTSSTSGFNIPYYNGNDEYAQLWWGGDELKFYQKGYTITGLKISIRYTKSS